MPKPLYPSITLQMTPSLHQVCYVIHEHPLCTCYFTKKDNYLNVAESKKTKTWPMTRLSPIHEISTHDCGQLI